MDPLQVLKRATHSVRQVRKLLFCSGKIYFELLEERDRRSPADREAVAVVRVEQLAPFPWDKVAEEVAKYQHAAVVCPHHPMT